MYLVLPMKFSTALTGYCPQSRSTFKLCYDGLFPDRYCSCATCMLDDSFPDKCCYSCSIFPSYCMYTCIHAFARTSQRTHLEQPHVSQLHVAASSGQAPTVQRQAQPRSSTEPSAPNRLDEADIPLAVLVHRKRPRSAITR